MEKVGLIASVFTDRIREICEKIESISERQLRIGYCYSLEAVKAGEEHPDHEWARQRGAHLPDRLQEVLRNCDLLLPVQMDGNDVSTLPLMTAKGTFVLTDGQPATELSERLRSTAEEYGTKMDCGSLFDEDIAERAVAFFFGR